MKRLILILSVLAFTAVALPSFASANTIEPLQYPGQYQQATGGYDITNAGLTDPTSFQISDARTSGSFGDWLFTAPNLVTPVGGEQAGRFTVSYTIQPVAGARSTPVDINGKAQWNHVSIAPDNGSGGRMSYLRFENRVNGVHVLFSDVPNHGKGFRTIEVATVPASQPINVRMVLNLTGTEARDTVQVSINDKQVTTGTSWKNYYIYNGESGTGLSSVPQTDAMIFQARGVAYAPDEGHGFVVSNVMMATS